MPIGRTLEHGWGDFAVTRMAKGRGAFGWILLAAGLIFAAAVVSLGQTKSATARLAGASAPSSTLTVKSNLVLVPVFVYDQARLAKASKLESACARATVAAFYKLRPTEPYLPKDCDATQIHGLTVKDFRLFQDGAEQKIAKVTAGGWWTVARDNLGWYMRSSLTPRGIWGSANLSRWKLVPPGINRDMYVLAYVPSSQKPGCHRIEVVVGREHALVFARDRYCAGQTTSDPLFGTGRGKSLEKMLVSKKKGKIPLSLQAAAFEDRADEPRVDIGLRFPWKDLYHKWDLSNWTLYARIAVMGAVRRRNGTVAARFSDLLYPSYWPTFVEGGAKFSNWVTGTSQLSGAIHSEIKGSQSAVNASSSNLGDTLAKTFPVAAGEITPDYEAFRMLLNSSDPAWLPSRYETQIDVPPGDYTLDVVLADGLSFGRAEIPLTVSHYDGNRLALSSLALCKRLRDAATAEKEDAQANFAPRFVPLVSKGIRFTLAGDKRFQKREPLFAYFEVYEPWHGGQKTAAVEIEIRILDASTGKIVSRFAPLDAAAYERSGSPVLRIARKIPFSQLARGSYVLEVKATDSEGGSTNWRAADFSVQ